MKIMLVLLVTISVENTNQQMVYLNTETFCGGGWGIWLWLLGMALS